MKLHKTEEKDIKEANKQENKKISKLVDKKTAKKVFSNLIIAVLVMAYFCIISAVYDNIHETGIIGVIKIATMVFLGIALILIEFAFKRESKTLLIHTFEALAIALHSLTIVYVTRVFNLDFKRYILVSSYIFSIYYVLKAIIINTKARKEYLNNLSDISDIVKKDEPTKKEAFKKEKQKEEVQEIIEEPENEKEKEKNEEKTAEVSSRFKNKKLADIRAKLRELQKQDEEEKNKEIKAESPILEDQKDEKVEEKKVENKKKKTTPKASTAKKKTTKKNENSEEETKIDKKENNVKEEKEQVEPAPKRKRGRPKKEVKKDD
ncbi:MAG: hypothetical protein IJJ82_00920 [Clostridia bacterium]|nr:hypothetical protein [Clostridia bacterium]